MAKLTQEEWNALTPEEQDTRKDEKPEDNGEPTVAELQKQIKDLETKISDAEGSHKKELSGMLYDLKQERKLRQDAEEKKGKEKEEEEGDPLKGKSDDDIVTVGEMRKSRTKEETDRKNRRIADIKERAADRMDRDEERMQDRTATKSERYPVTYNEALEAFDELVLKDKTLWDEVNREALRPGGRPAQKMYDIALTQHPELSKTVKKSEREKILEELEEKGEIPKRLPGGGTGKGEVNLEEMDDIALMKYAEEHPEALDKAAGKK